MAYTFDSKEDLINSPEFKEAMESTLDEKVTEILAKQDKEGKITEMQDKLEAKDSELTKINEKIVKMEADMAEILEKAENEKKSRELTILAKTRFDELTEAGVTYSDDRLEKVMSRLKSMSDDDYSEYKEDMVSNIPAKNSDDKNKSQNAKIVLIPNKSTASNEEFPFMKHMDKAFTFNTPALSAEELKN